MITDADSKKLLTDFSKVFTTKDDLKDFATKDDLKDFATKDDLNSFATKNDVQIIVDQAILVHDEKIDQQLTQFRSDIFDKLDQVIGELQTNRQEREVIAHQVSDHEDRLTVVETKLQLA